MTDFIDNPGGMERFREYAGTLTTGPGQQGPAGETFPITGQYCVASARKSLLGVDTTPVEVVRYNFASGELDGLKDAIQIDACLDIVDLHGCGDFNPHSIRLFWNNTQLTPDMSISESLIRNRMVLYQYLLDSTQVDAAVFGVLTTRGQTSLSANWMARGGLLRVFIRTNCPQVDLNIYSRIFKVIG